PVVLAHVLAAPRRFVDVVAEMDDEVGLVGDEVAVGAEEALLVLLARGEGEAQPRRRRVGGGRRVKAADRARRACGVEAIEVPAVGREAGELDARAVAP